jgi:hypothetical protein
MAVFWGTMHGVMALWRHITTQSQLAEYVSTQMAASLMLLSCCLPPLR